MDVVGVVTPLRGGAQVVLHGDQVVELSVLLGVHEEGEVEEDGEGQVEVQLARVGVRVHVVDVVCVMLVLVARVVVHAVSTQFS